MGNRINVRNAKVLFLTVVTVIFLNGLFSFYRLTNDIHASLVACSFLTYLVGACVGGAYCLMKYVMYSMYKIDFLTNEEDKEYYEHDHKTFMIIRNMLFYIGLSWYGAYSFLFDEN